MQAHIGFVCFTFLVFTLFSLGLYTFLSNYEPNRCNMTFMYEYPQLIKVPLHQPINKTYNKYGLYAYGEGRMANRVRSMKFNGLPVLFIPGNRGSPKQVRSLASVSLSKALGTRNSIFFDFFAVDLNEDFSGLYGGFLKEQTTYVNLCIKKILSLYKGSPKAATTSVVIIAHSMGGMIAKGLFLEPDFNPELVRLIITLATPHSPAIILDHLIASYYSSVNGFWDNYNATENNINLISIGGGPRDLLVQSELTMTKHADLSVLTTEIPTVWKSVDHLCILWCNELVVTIVRTLFDLVNLQTKQISNDLKNRSEILKYHLLNRSAGKSYYSSPVFETIDFSMEDNDSSWIEMTGTNYVWRNSDLPTYSPSYVIISLAIPLDLLAIVANNHGTRDWIFGCISHTIQNGIKKCKIGTNLSVLGRIAPTLHGKRKTAVINLSYLRRDRFTHIVVRTLPSKESTEIYFDLSKKRDRIVTVSSYYFLSDLVVPNTANDSLFYSLEIPVISKFWHIYQVTVTPTSCPLDVFAVASVRVPWNNEGSTKFLTRSTSNSIEVSSLAPKQNNEGSVAVDLFLHPTCSYKISVERSFILTLGSVVRKFSTVLITHITVCLLLSLAYQVKCLGENGSSPLLHFIMPITAKPYFIIQASALVGTVAQNLVSWFPYLPETDIKHQSGFVEVVVIPVFFHLTAFCITYCFATGVLVSVVVQGQAFNGIFLRFINKFFFGLTWLSEYVLSFMNKVPIVVSAFMITVASSACGGLALSIGLFFYFFKLISLYEDFWEEIVYWPLTILKWVLKRRRDGQQMEMPRFQIPPIKDISFHLTLMLLWSVSTLISAPSVLVWAKNYKFSTHLSPDPTFYNAALMSACAGILWQTQMPKTGLPWSRHVGYAIVGCSILMMVYGQASIYRISYILSGVFVLVTLHQLLCGFFVSEDDEPIVQLVPIEEEEPSTQEIEEASTESSPLLIDSKTESVLQQDLSDTESNELEEDKSKSGNGNEQDISSRGSSTSSFEHISEQEQLKSINGW